MNKIILTGVRDIKTDEKIKAGKDYVFSLLAQRISEELIDSNSDEETDGVKYRCKVLSLEQILEVGTSDPVKFEKGKSPSQKQRFIIEGELGTDMYEPFMSWLLGKIPVLCEKFRENNN
jgi:hypothetical protein